MSESLALHPQWKQAVRDFLTEFKCGDLVPHDWLVEHFGMPALRDSSKLSVTEFRRRQLDLLENVEAFKRELLQDHQVFLQSVRGDGYRWVPPGDQTGLAMREFEQDARKAFRSAGQRLRHVRVAELTDAQRQQNMDSIAKLSALRGMSRKALR